MDTLYKKINKVFDFLLSLGYPREEIIEMTKAFPGIYSYSIENMKQKIGFYDSIGMHELAIIDAKLLMQSVDLSYARYEFFKENGIEINMANYRKLFICQKQFEKQYGVTKQELLEKYDYNEFSQTYRRKYKSYLI